MTVTHGAECTVYRLNAKGVAHPTGITRQAVSKTQCTVSCIIVPQMAAEHTCVQSVHSAATRMASMYLYMV